MPRPAAAGHTGTSARGFDAPAARVLPCVHVPQFPCTSMYFHVPSSLAKQKVYQNDEDAVRQRLAAASRYAGARPLTIFRAYYEAFKLMPPSVTAVAGIAEATYHAVAGIDTFAVAYIDFYHFTQKCNFCIQYSHDLTCRQGRLSNKFGNVTSRPSPSTNDIWNTNTLCCGGPRNFCAATKSPSEHDFSAKASVAKAKVNIKKHLTINTAAFSNIFDVANHASTMSTRAITFLPRHCTARASGSPPVSATE